MMKTVVSIIVLLLWQTLLAPALFWLGYKDFVMVAVFDPPLALLILFGLFAGCQSQREGFPVKLFERLSELLFVGANAGFLVYRHAQSPFASAAFSVSVVCAALWIVWSWKSGQKSGC